jgi:hypothetical protein
MAIQLEQSYPNDVSVELAKDDPQVLSRAKRNDREALAAMFSRFLPDEEPVLAAEYLGVEGMWGLGTHSFAAVTNRRVAAIRVRIFGEVIYQDAALEHINSSVIFQPSIVMLYLYVGAVTIMTAGLGLLLLPLSVRLYYRFKKSGLVLWVREGVSVYAFSDRKLLGRANDLYRQTALLQEQRLLSMRAASDAYA